MSRGRGRVERDLIARVSSIRTELRPELWLPVHAPLLEQEQWPLRGHADSYRRAAHALEAAGAVELVRAQSPYYADPWYFHVRLVFRTGLFIRLPLSDQDREEAAELEEEFFQALKVTRDESAPLSERTRAVKWIAWYQAAQSDVAVWLDGT